MSKPCIICYKLTNGTDLSSGASHSSNGNNTENGDPPPGSSPEGLSQFFKMLERYLDDDDKSCRGTAAGAEEVKQFNFEGAIHAGLISCRDCSKLVESFCDLHHQMKSIELLLNWKLWTLKNIMLGGQRVSSRMKDFRKYANQLEIEDVSADDIIEFKRDLVTKCRQKLATTYPKLTIKKCCPVDKAIKPGPVSESNETNGATNPIPINENESDDDDDDDNFELDGSADFHEDIVPLVGENNIESPIPILNAPQLVEESICGTSRLRQHYRCSTCSNTFSSQERMDKHNQTHIMQKSSEEVPEDANENPEPQEELLGEEETDANETLQPPVPATQNLKMRGRKLLKRYEWRFNSQTGNYKCRHCTKEFSRKTSVCLHFQSVHLKLKYQCPKCSQGCTQKWNLKRHLRNAHFDWWSKVTNKEEVLTSAKQGFKSRNDQRQPPKSSKLPTKKKNPGEEFNSSGRRITGADVEQAVIESMLQPQHSKRQQSIKIQSQPNMDKQCNPELVTPAPNRINLIQSSSDGKDVRSDQWSNNPCQTGKYKCSHCPKRFRCKTSVCLHHQHAHLHLKYKCPKCSKVCTQKGNLDSHLRHKHFEWWSTVKNKKEALASAKREINLRNDQQQPTISQPPSGEELPPPPANDSQSWSTVDPLTGRHKCSLCSKQLANLNSLKVHYQNLHLKLRYKCQKCGKEYSFKAQLSTHMKAVHFGRSFKCSFCPLSFSNSSSRSRHLRAGCQKRNKWNGINRPDDEVDSKPVLQAVQLYSFVKYEGTSTSQAEIEDFPVEATPLLFGAGSEAENFLLPDQMPVMQPEPEPPASGLERPLPMPRLVNRKRANLYKYKCNICKKGFPTKQGMTYHMVIVHSWKSPNSKHQCEFCQKQFYNLAGRILHQQTVHQGKRFPCPHCSKTFSHPSSRNRHIKKKECSGSRFIP